ncbi:hypothetical protein [Marinovum sp.]|uniref:hypothetical protein n=1 Tax=Marinovum sp. TaxID=2024839 RepID=UPI003A8E04DD
MKPIQACSAALLAALLAAPAVAQEAYVEVLGGKGYVEELGSTSHAEDYGRKGYVPVADSYAPAARTRVRVSGVAVRQVSVVLPGCVMGMGVMQRGTLICPGH